MDAVDKAIAAAVERQRLGAPNAQGTAFAKPVAPTRAAAKEVPKVVDPWSPEAILRAANEDDDLYDPYSDYMDALARSSREEPEADPWR